MGVAHSAWQPRDDAVAWLCADRLSIRRAHRAIKPDLHVRYHADGNIREILDGLTGGLMLSPTHVLEPEVPPANIAAFFEECDRTPL